MLWHNSEVSPRAKPKVACLGTQLRAEAQPWGVTQGEAKKRGIWGPESVSQGSAGVLLRAKGKWHLGT